MCVAKVFTLTGGGIGYAAGPANLIGTMTKIQSQRTSNPCSSAQAAAQEALKGPKDCVSMMVKAFKERHDYVVSTLNKIEGVKCIESDGTFYAFPSLAGAIAARDDISTDIELAEKLLGEAGVAIVPGSAFGTADHARLSFATSMGVLEDALGRLKKGIEG